MIEVIFYPFTILIALPGVGLLPGIAFALAYVKTRRSLSTIRRATIILITLLWLIYGMYETGMYFWMKTVIAPIRIDLLLIAPFLSLVSLVGIMVLLTRNVGRKVNVKEAERNPGT